MVSDLENAAPTDKVGLGAYARIQFGSGRAEMRVAQNSENELSVRFSANTALAGKTRQLQQNNRAGRYHGWDMDSLREWMESDLDVIMVGTWMLCGNGWSLICTLSWLGHMLCGNGWSLIWGYHGWDMDAVGMDGV